jgi:myo-inositol-1(or 4)-monophosphatase
MNYNPIVELVYNARSLATDRALRDDVALKGEADFVTAVDTAISRFVKEGLATLAPGSAFVTEEESHHSNAPDRFILDPIDGTANLVRGYKKSSISLAHYKNGEILFGVVYDPFSGELFFALKGKGAHYFDAANGIAPLLAIGVEHYTAEPLSVSALTHENAIVEFGAGSTNKSVSAESFEIGKEVFESCQDLRRICSSALAICYIAAGRIDGYFERRIKPWDYAAGMLIAQEAGAVVSDWQGNPLAPEAAAAVLVSSKKIHSSILNLIREVQKQ